MAMSNFASSENTTAYSFKYNLHGNNGLQGFKFNLSLTGKYFYSTISIYFLQFYFSQDFLQKNTKKTVIVVSKNGLSLQLKYCYPLPWWMTLLLKMKKIYIYIIVNPHSLS